MRLFAFVLFWSVLFPFALFAHDQPDGGAAMEQTMAQLRDSVDRFDAHFQRTVDEYGRTESVRKVLEDQVLEFRLDGHSRIDFAGAARQMHRRLQKFFNDKMTSLRRLVRAAELAARKVDVDRVLGPTLGDEAACERHMRALNASAVLNVGVWEKVARGETHAMSGVHVALESYKCSGAVQRDFNWTGSYRIENAMDENARKDGGIARQYVGTYSGLTRVFPGFHWDMAPEQFSIDLFDPRFRPWFTAAETAPRDVLFLLDFSGSAKGLNAHLIKTSVMAVMQTLTPNDFISGFWYNSRREQVLANCTGNEENTFVPANSRNKLLFRRFLDRIEERDQAALPPAMELSFAQFVRSENVSGAGDGAAAGDWRGSRRSGGHNLILLFTDGIEFWPTEVVQRFQRQHPSDPIRVFGHSIGHGRGPQPALAWLTCHTRAGMAQAEIGSVADIRLRARAHLAKLSEVLALSYRDKAPDPDQRPIAWPSPYMDAQKGGPVVSLSMPILGQQPGIYRDLDLAREQLLAGEQGTAGRARLDGFLGVAGVDVAFGELARQLTLDGEPDPGKAYAFLVDNNGLAYFHPKMHTPAAEVFAVRRTLCHRISTLLRSNTRVPFTRADELVQHKMGLLDSIAQRDILELEDAKSTLWRRFRRKLISVDCAEPLEDERTQLRCFPLAGTPLVAGLVLRKGAQSVRLREQREEEVPLELAERFRASLLSPAENDATKGRPQQSNSSRRRTPSPFPASSVGILLREGRFLQSELSARLSALKPFARFASLVQLLPSAPPPLLARLSGLHPDRLFPVWASQWPAAQGSPSCPPRPLPPRIDQRLFVSAFLELCSQALLNQFALTAFFPKCELSSFDSFVRASRNLPEQERERGSLNGRMRVHVDLERGGMLTVERSLGWLGAEEGGAEDAGTPLARIGVQLRGHFLQQKLQRALQQPAAGWAECTKPGRSCLLVSGDSVLLASSDPSANSVPPSFRPVHLSAAEPELFAELLARGFIFKTVWRDPDALCPMVVTLDPRQAQRQQYLQHIQQQLSGEANSASSTAAPSLLRRLVSLLLPASWMWLDNTSLLALLLPPVFALPPDQQPSVVPLGDSPECDYDAPPELVEHCTVERVHYQMRARAKDGEQPQSGGIWLRERKCNRTVGLLPFGHAEMFLVLVDGGCARSEPSPASAAPFLLQKQVPNCNLTRDSLSLERRLRADLDYTRAHPKEFNPICANSAPWAGTRWLFASLSLAFSLGTLLLIPAIRQC